MVKINDIYEAKNRIANNAKITDCIRMDKISTETGVEVYLKLENLQLSNSFKKRGASNKILSLSKEERDAGVICASAGNHAQGVASTATCIGVRSVIVMPKTAPQRKVDATKNYGGEVVLFGDTFDEAYGHAVELAEKDGLTFIHPFDDPKIIAGQGTIGIEILNQLENKVDAIVAGIGGGGLLAGIGVAVKSLNPNVEVIGVQAENAPAMKESFDKKEYTCIPTKPSLADGMNVANPGKMTFDLICQTADRIELVSEEFIAKGIKKLATSCRIVSEGAGATGIAALLEGKLDHLKGKTVVFVVSGGNIDEDKFAAVLTK